MDLPTEHGGSFHSYVSLPDGTQGVFFHADLMALEWNFMEVFYRTRWYSPPRNRGLAGDSMYLGLVVGVFNIRGMCGIRCGKMGVGVQSSKYDHAGIVKTL